MKLEWVWQPVPGPGDAMAMAAVLKRLAEEQELREELVATPERPRGMVTEAVYLKVLVQVADQEQSERLLASAKDSQYRMVIEQHAAELERDRPELAGWGLAGALAVFLGRAGTPTGLTPWIVAALALALGARVAWRLWLRRQYCRRAAAVVQRWEEVLRHKVLKPYFIQQMNASVDRRERTVAGADIRPTDYGHDPEYAVTSAAMSKVSDASRTVTAGSIGISGPRGAGKTTILNKLDTRIDQGKPEQDIRVYVSAPVDYDAREFIIHLFSELCAKVLAEAPALSPIATLTRRQLSRLRFLSTYSSAWGPGLVPSALLAPLGLGSLAGAFGSLAWSPGKQKAEQPAGLPAIVEQFRAYSGQVAEWTRTSRGKPGPAAGHSDGRVIICIDEMDKIRDSGRAEQFLNGIKAIFDVPGCLYLVSISEDAMAVFASQTPAIKTAFDSAFDEIISVGPMTFEEARELLDLRVTGVPLPFLALCHVLAGGVPRELIRAARSLYQVTRPEPQAVQAAAAQAAAPTAAAVRVDLAAMTKRLVGDRCEVMRQQAILQLGGSGAPPDIIRPLYRQGWPGKAPGSLAPRELTDAADALNEEAAGGLAGAAGGPAGAAGGLADAAGASAGGLADAAGASAGAAGWPAGAAGGLADAAGALADAAGASAGGLAGAAGGPAGAAGALNGKAAGLADDEWRRMRLDVQVALHFYATVVELFAEHGEDVVSDVTAAGGQRIDGLATVRHAMRMNSEVAQALLEVWRDGLREGGGSAGN